jgi:2-C-methyl-D-erythritol 4-phosphate cytidylyltransferase
MGGATPKQYLSLAGIPLLLHTLETFQNTSCIDAVILVVPADGGNAAPFDVAERPRIPKLRWVVAGGKERQDSVRNALACLHDDDGIVVIHDGVRPLVTAGLIERIVEKAVELGAVAAGIDIRDTVKRVDHSGIIEETVPREHLWLTQTPQAFRKDILLNAYRHADEEGYCGTDDASLVERNGCPVWMIPGERDNIKVTTQEDIAFCEMVLTYRMLRGEA